MLKLKQYIKPYAGLLLLAVALLFGQAMLELMLPSLMSRLVDTGIQRGGIEEIAPQVVSRQSMHQLQQLMSEDDAQTVREAYMPLAQAAYAEPLLQKYPQAAQDDWVLRPNADSRSAGDAFARAGFVMMKLAQTDRPTPAVYEQAQALALNMPPTLVGQTAGVLIQRLYTELGADMQAMQTGYIARVGLQMLGLTLLLTACAIGAGYCMARLGAGVGRDLRRDVFARVTYFSRTEMDRYSTASLITRSTNDVQQIQAFLSMGLRLLCFAPIMGIGGLVMGISTSAGLAWVLLLALIVLLGVIVTLFLVAMPRFKKMQHFVDRLNLVAREQLSGLMVVRAFSNQDFMQKRFDEANHDLAGNTLFVNRAMAVLMPVVMLVMNGISLLIVWFGGRQIAQSSLQVGDMMAFIQYAMHVIMSFLFISMIFIMLPRASVSAERVMEVLETQCVLHEPNVSKRPKQPRGVVEFEHVSFCYDGAGDHVLSNLSFTARPGQTTALIGSTGAGKSTLVGLIARLYDVTQGSVKIDGVDVRSMKLHELREMLGYVPQKASLFSGTIGSNLRYASPDATLQQVQAAAEIAQAHEFIQQLEGGYDALVSQGGGNVSGGQRQRLSVARALVRQTPIYIFDDTFSALDFKTDARLRAALKAVTKHATVLMVAQRISTIRDADQIIVLDEGRMAGIGTHDELMRTCKTYQELAKSQLPREELL